jgi:hypothetical protein
MGELISGPLRGGVVRSIITMASNKPTPERKRVSFPGNDDSVLRWWAEQHDPSLSIRLLIRAELARSGYVDYASQPIGDVLKEIDAERLQPSIRNRGRTSDRD